MLVSHSGPGVLPSVRQMEPSESASSSNLSLAKARPSSELNGQSPSHLKVQRSVSSNHKQRRYSEQGERPAGGRGPSVTSAALMVILPDVQRAALTHRPSLPHRQSVRTSLLGCPTQRGVRPPQRRTAPRRKAESRCVNPALRPPPPCWATPTTPTRPTSPTAGKAPPPGRA